MGQIAAMRAAVCMAPAVPSSTAHSIGAPEGACVAEAGFAEDLRWSAGFGCCPPPPPPPPLVLSGHVASLTPY
jgi:hypothetical protein